jgi:plasmid stability protein
MPAMTIRNISAEAHRALKKRAALRGTSAEAEVRSMLEEIVPRKERAGLGTEMAAIAKKYGGSKLEIPRSKRPPRFATFK